MNKKEILMPKERSVCNTLIFNFLTLFLSTTIPAFAQFHIEGKYSVKQSIGMSVGEAYVYYNFNKYDTFEYHSGSHNCNGDCEYANGNYQIQDSTVIINYTSEPVLVSNVERREWSEHSDSITIRFKVTNLDNRFDELFVVFYPEKKQYRQNMKNGIFLRFIKQKDPLTFMTSVLGYTPVYFAFPGERSTEVNFNLPVNNVRVLSGFTEKARVVDSRDGLVTTIMFENGTKIFLQE